MPDSKKQPSDSQGVLGQMSRLKHHSNATADELRTFIQSMKGQNPQQMLGMIAQSDLVRSTAIAAIFFVVLLMVFTFVPAMMSDGDGKAVAAAPAKDQVIDGKNDRTKNAKADTKKAVASKDAKDGKTKQPTANIPGKEDDILKSLNIGDSKTVDPKSNPLDGIDLFKDLK